MGWRRWGITVARDNPACGAAKQIRDRLDMVMTDAVTAAAAISAAARGAPAKGALASETKTSPKRRLGCFLNSRFTRKVGGAA